jgi:hypothetical protein
MEEIKKEEFKVAYFSFENLGTLTTTGENDIIVSGYTNEDDSCMIVLDMNDFYNALYKWLKKSKKLFNRCSCFGSGGFVCVHVCEWINEDKKDEEPIYYCHVLKVEMCKGKECWKDEKKEG